ncbi:conserved hypothetical protein [delta proteobacterium NaphS2]|nr:conserved hypothetical protein [delta proteobacterium NaphS2]
MTIQEELKEIFFETKRLISACREMGLEPPMLQKEALDFIEHRPDKKKPSTPETASPSPSPSFDSLKALRDHMGDCKRCNLHTGRKTWYSARG